MKSSWDLEKRNTQWNNRLVLTDFKRIFDFPFQRWDHIKIDNAPNVSGEMACVLDKTKAYLQRIVGEITPEVELVVHYMWND